MTSSIKVLVLTLAVSMGALFTQSASAKSQCSGLSSSACSSNKTCTWRKSSVDKNGKKTKAHCRALPGQAKNVKTSASKKAKSSASSSTSSVSSKGSSATSKAKSKTKSASSTSKSSKNLKDKAKKKAKAKKKDK